MAYLPENENFRQFTGPSLPSPYPGGGYYDGYLFLPVQPPAQHIQPFSQPMSPYPPVSGIFSTKYTICFTMNSLYTRKSSFTKYPTIPSISSQPTTTSTDAKWNSGKAATKS